MVKKPTISRGSRAQVMNGTAKCTAGGLMKKDLMKRNGRIISVVKHKLGMAAKKKKGSTLKKFVPPKGQFGAVLDKKTANRSSTKKKRSKSKQRGGAGVLWENEVLQFLIASKQNGVFFSLSAIINHLTANKLLNNNPPTKRQVKLALEALIAKNLAKRDATLKKGSGFAVI